MKDSDKSEIFEALPVSKALAKLAIPTIISQLITMIYNLADTFFIGSTGDPYKVAAATMAFTLFFILNALSNLFGIGGGSLISRMLGEGRKNDAGDVCAVSMILSFLTALAYSVLCLFFREPLLSLLGASGNTMKYASDYIFHVVCIGGIPAMLSLSMSHILRSEGYAGEASLGLGIGGILNIILDPILMFLILPEGKEVTGAAMATTISNVFSLVYFIMKFSKLKERTALSVSPSRFIPGLSFFGQIFSVGFPSALGNILSCLSNLVVNMLSAGYGDITVAAMGIVKKIEMLPMNVGMGLCQGMLPLVAYNYAAKKYDRMKEAVRKAGITGMCFALLCVVLFELFSSEAIRIFIDDDMTVSMGAVLLRINCIATPMMIWNFHISFAFQAVGKGSQSLLLSSCRTGLFQIPLLFLLNCMLKVFGLAVSQPIADALTLLIAIILYRKFNVDLRRKIQSEET